MSYALVEAEKALEQVKVIDPVSKTNLAHAMTYLREAMSAIANSATIAGSDQTDCSNAVQGAIQGATAGTILKNSTGSALSFTFNGTTYSIANGKAVIMETNLAYEVKRRLPTLSIGTLSDLSSNGVTIHIA